MNFNDYLLLFEIHNENNFFIAEIKLLLANESVEDSPAMENTKSVVTNNTEGSVELRTLNPETVGSEMQGELDNGMVPKGNSFTKPRQDFVSKKRRYLYNRIRKETILFVLLR